MIEKIPFLHRKRMYNIIVQEDISFDACTISSTADRPGSVFIAKWT